MNLAYTLDTNAILYYLKDDSNAVSLLREIFAHDAPVYISAITELELFAFSNLLLKNTRLSTKLSERFLSFLSTPTLRGLLLSYAESTGSKFPTV
ncbi:MAG: PIN domain-containing protein [Deltaproteobacteria bacterium]|nr:PIN domain-containing protein [Deltaproteobacteria bacterium]